MQTDFKHRLPPFIEEIQRDLRVAVQEASHVILMGYSLPPDDVSYRALFAARRGRDSKNPVKCSVVVGKDHEDRWRGPSDLLSLPTPMTPVEAPGSTLLAAQDLFGQENVKFYGAGIPNVFLDGRGNVSEERIEQLLLWSAAGH